MYLARGRTLKMPAKQSNNLYILIPTHQDGDFYSPIFNIFHSQSFALLLPLGKRNFRK